MNINDVLLFAVQFSILEVSKLCFPLVFSLNDNGPLTVLYRESKVFFEFEHTHR